MNPIVGKISIGTARIVGKNIKSYIYINGNKKVEC